MILCFIITACVSTNVPQPNENKVVHIVFIWLNEPGNEEHIKKIISSAQELRKIPQIQELRIGKSIPSDRKIVDDSFDIGLYMTFASKTGLKTYLVHDLHKQLVRSTLQPIVNKIIVYDFLSTDYQ
jgi:hypothetical protein